MGLEPKSALVKLQAGRVFESRGQLDQAAIAYDEAAALDSTWPAPRLASLAVQMKQGDAAGALAGLRALPEELRATGEADLLLGRLLARQEEWGGALVALDRAVLAFPGRAEAHAERGTAAYNAGELKLAAEAYARAVELDPRNLGYLSSHALYLSYAGQPEEGLAAMLKAMERPEAQTADALTQLAGIYRSFRPPRVAEAVAAYEKVLKLDPKDGQAALAVAESYREGRQWAKAISAYERVEQAHPRLKGEALLGTAWSHYWSGDDTRAKFYTGLAVRAGADVDEIREAFSRPPGATRAAVELDELGDQLRSKNAGVQARAVRGLLELGRPAVPSLAAALPRKGTSLAAREQIVDGLGRLGPAARDALPQLDRLAKATPPHRPRRSRPSRKHFGNARPGSRPRPRPRAPGSARRAPDRPRAAARWRWGTRFRNEFSQLLHRRSSQASRPTRGGLMRLPWLHGSTIGPWLPRRLKSSRCSTPMPGCPRSGPVTLSPGYLRAIERWEALPEKPLAPTRAGWAACQRAFDRHFAKARARS